jgi:hypothetical protein
MPGLVEVLLTCLCAAILSFSGIKAGVGGGAPIQVLAQWCTQSGIKAQVGGALAYIFYILLVLLTYR